MLVAVAWLRSFIITVNTVLDECYSVQNATIKMQSYTLVDRHRIEVI